MGALLAAGAAGAAKVFERAAGGHDGASAALRAAISVAAASYLAASAALTAAANAELAAAILSTSLCATSKHNLRHGSLETKFNLLWVLLLLRISVCSFICFLISITLLPDTRAVASMLYSMLFCSSCATMAVAFACRFARAAALAASSAATADCLAASAALLRLLLLLLWSTPTSEPPVK